MKVDFDDSGIKNLQKVLQGGGYTLKIGILEDKDKREGDGIGNAYLGLIHEFGSRENDINENSFLRMPLNEVFPKRLDQYQLTEKQDILEEAVRLGGVRNLLKKIGGIAVSTITEAFMSQGFGTWSNKRGPNKKTGMVLLDTKKLMRSITFKVQKGKAK